MTQPLEVAQSVADRYSALPQVEAVALAGSQGFQTADADSDLDLYVYAAAEIPIETRRAIATHHADRSEVGNAFWEPGDEWIEADTRVDVMFRSPSWIEAQLDRVLVQHQASVGYSTCFWHNVLASRPLFDRQGWYHQLQRTAQQPYPEPLRSAIIAKNYPILRHTQSSYLYQIERAIGRGDRVSLNHRVAALLASYFDILFAVNRLPHPGEKRLIAIAADRCPQQPAEMKPQVEGLIEAVGQPEQAVARAIDLLNNLDDFLNPKIDRERQA